MRQAEGDRHPPAAGAAGAADAVDVIVGARGVVIEDVVTWDVEAAGGDVGGDQELQIAGAEAVERLGAQDWSRSPWIGAASKPWRFSERATTSTSVLRLQKMMPLRTSLTLVIRRGVLRGACGSPPGSMMTRWSIVVAVGGGACGFDALRVERNCSVRRVISGGMVAEKKSVWRVKGVS